MIGLRLYESESSCARSLSSFYTYSVYTILFITSDNWTIRFLSKHNFWSHLTRCMLHACMRVYLLIFQISVWRLFLSRFLIKATLTFYIQVDSCWTTICVSVCSYEDIHFVFISSKQCKSHYHWWVKSSKVNKHFGDDQPGKKVNVSVPLKH